MATRVSLTPMSALPVGANAPAFIVVNGLPVLAFDTTTNETCQWDFVVPQGVTGAWTAVIHYFMLSATTGSVAFDVSIMAVTDGDAGNLNTTLSFDSVNSGSDAAVPGSTGVMGEVSVTLTNADSLAAGDQVWVRLARVTDSAAADCYVTGMELRDAA